MKTDGNSRNGADSPKMAEQVAQRLRKQIMRGELKAGAHLPPESDLLAQLGVSRPTLRAALRILESESLLRISHGSPKGPLIQLPNPRVAAKHVGLVLQSRGATVADVYGMRLLCEPLAVRVVASCKDPLAISGLNAAIADERTVLGDPKRFGHAALRFHETLFDHTGNQTFALVFELLHTIFEHHMDSLVASFAHPSDTLEGRKKAIRAQERLVELIQAGDAHQAETFWSLHLARLHQVLLQNPKIERVVDLLE